MDGAPLALNILIYCVGWLIVEAGPWALLAGVGHGLLKGFRKIRRYDESARETKEE